MATGLEHLLDEGVISEVLARLQGGKEAEVFVVRYGGKVVAAKVYKNRAHRSFKNNSDYKEGRGVRSSRSQRAMTRGTRFGQAASEDAWKSAEVDALYKLHAAGVRVPSPVVFLDGVLLMELVLDAHGEPAPRLIDVRLTADQANVAYHDMVKQLVRILSCDLIHGDLSPYNVLWGAAGPTIIDFPQIVSASQSSRSEFFFLRDARNILGHFANVDRRLHGRSGDPAEIWRAYVRRDLSPEFTPALRANPPRTPQRGIEPSARQPSRPASQQRGGGPPSRGAHGPPSKGPAPAQAPTSAPRRSPRMPEVIVQIRRGGHAGAQVPTHDSASAPATEKDIAPTARTPFRRGA